MRVISSIVPSIVVGDKIPFEVWYEYPISYIDSLHVFGSTTYHHVKEYKVDPRAKKAISLGW